MAIGYGEPSPKPAQRLQPPRTDHGTAQGWQGHAGRLLASQWRYVRGVWGWTAQADARRPRPTGRSCGA